MAKKGFTPEQIINKLREAEILLNQGATIAVAPRRSGSVIIPTIAGGKNTAV